MAFVKLGDEQIAGKLSFVENYIAAKNAADGSVLDANANVSKKNIATLEAEIHKDFNIQINRALVAGRIEKLYGKGLADEYIRQIKDHEIYVHDETSLKPYCVSVNMYPLLTEGLRSLGGESGPPKHLESFCGSFVNYVFAVSSQFAGAVATVEFLMYFDHFASLDYGDDYLVTKKRTIENCLQHVVYAINQPAAARGYQSVFWNISLYDEHYFNSLFGDFAFPNENFTEFRQPKWERLKKLQEFFINWFNEERKKAVLTFPVVTAALLVDGETKQVKDVEFRDMLASNISRGGSFFTYMSESADSLASCCRLRNEIEDNTFSYSLGAGGVATGSINVITINVNRLVQTGGDIGEQVDKIHKYQIAYRNIVEEYLSAGMLPVYDAGFITLDKQFLTIGINGMAEAALFKGIKVGYNDEYKAFVESILKPIFDKNKQIKKETGYMFNTEFVPAENLGVKNAGWDKQDGLFSPNDCYNSYFYLVEDNEPTIIDKFRLHGREFNQYLDGGSALHLNLESYPSEESARLLFDTAAKTGCNYWCTNIKITICNKCGHIDKRTLDSCSSCGSEDVDHATRVIGYLKRISSFSTPRQKEASLRFYH